MLRELGCGLAQGFLYSNPLPPAAVAALLDGTTRGRVGTRPDGRERERCPLRANARGPAECLQRRNP